MSSHPVAEKVNSVMSSLPSEGSILNCPQQGGVLAWMVRMLFTFTESARNLEVEVGFTATSKV